MTDTPAHILIVDDTPENIRVLATVLAPNKYRLTIATSGESALAAAEQHIPDLILLDVMMPEIDGFGVCRRLKSNPKTKNIEIVFVTAAVNETEELKGLGLGAADYIYKPFSIPVIQAKVALYLERASHRKDLRLKNEALEEIIKLRDDIERITRHDLKTPLNAILGYPQLMQMDDNLTDEQREYLEEISRAGKEMTNMINNSLDMFKMETGSYQFHPEWVDLSLLIKTIVKDLTTFIEMHQVNVTVSQELPAIRERGLLDNFTVLGEKSLSYSLFANLIRNAIEACCVDGTVKIDMKYEGDEGVISICNPGTVPEEIREKFFDKYATAGKSHGTGLGTYSAKLMTITQKGSITMETNSQETCIVVRLPCQQS